MNESIDKIIAALEKALGAASPYAQRGWEILVSGERTTGYIGLFFGSLSLVAFVVACWGWVREYRKGRDSEEWILVPTFLATVVTLVFGIAMLVSNAESALAPEYVTLKDMIGGACK